MNRTLNYRTLACCFLAGLISTAMAQSAGELRGVIKDADNLQPVPFATIKILQDKQLIGGTQTDENGRYTYKPLVPGTYELMVIESGYLSQPVNKIKVIPNEATYVDVKLTATSLGTITVVAKPIDYTRTGVDKTMFNQISVDAEELNHNASYTRGDIKGVLEAVTSEVVATGDGKVHFRGARDEATGYFVDGVRTLYPGTIPGLAIENLSVFPGGVPAMYGDLTSGAVIVTTRSYFSGIREKNVRLAAKKESEEQAKADKKSKEEEEKRAKEIEKEKEAARSGIQQSH